MKKYCLYLAASLLSFNSSIAQIKNGYEKEINGIKESLASLTNILASDFEMSTSKKHQIRANVAKLSEYVMYYQLDRGIVKSI